MATTAVIIGSAGPCIITANIDGNSNYIQSVVVANTSEYAIAVTMTRTEDGVSTQQTFPAGLTATFDSSGSAITLASISSHSPTNPDAHPTKNVQFDFRWPA